MSRPYTYDHPEDCWHLSLKVWCIYHDLIEGKSLVLQFPDHISSTVFGDALRRWIRHGGFTRRRPKGHAIGVVGCDTTFEIEL